MEDHHSGSPTEDTAHGNETPEAQSEEDCRAQEIARALEAATEAGHQAASVEYERRIAVERGNILKCCSDFLQSREEYFAGLEEQAVKLALAIAKRILHREVKVEPLVLQGAVNAALSRIAGESGTILRVPVAETEDWRKLFQGNPPVAVEVRGETQLAAGECILDTNLGRVELGIGEQMEEIEKSFSDLQHQRAA